MNMNISTPEWVKDAVFYQIFPDRFAKCSRLPKAEFHLEAWDALPTNHGFKGGDLLGVVEHLDYLKDLGITALYLNPIFASASNHRYHTYDYYAVDPLLGGNAAFRELLDAAHKRNIRVILDGVFNHASRGFWQFHHVLENGAGSPYVDWFHFNRDRLNGKKHWGAYPTPEEQEAIEQGGNTYDVLGYSAWWNLPALPKFNTGSNAVREFIWGVAEHWVKFGIDGWRLDVPGEIDDDSFWQEFRHRVKAVNPDAYIVGEIWNEAQRWLQGDQFDAVMNYLLTGTLLGFLMKDNLDDKMYSIGDFRNYLRPLDAPAFADRIDTLQGLYDPLVNQAQFNLLDSHDTPRFLTTVHNDKNILKLAWLFLFTLPGAPCIYYGDEIGMDGGADPLSRKSFSWDENCWDHDLRQYLQKLITLRKDNPLLRRGTVRRLYADGNLYAFARELGKESMVIVLNASNDPASVSFPVNVQGWTSGQLKTAFGDARISLRDGQIKDLKLGPHSGVVLKK
jgi:cyclomaltodextrinase / maltogenic alpha-amylase / neopullulanase